jgi:UDP-N-acetylglucosamine--N-acetylmuramyl-(pentapeptide) pyrophosphoryl-undecaprenol N-acetylglucosamine transferase
MNEILSVADLIVCRAGAMTIGEIKEFRVPAILVPFAQAAGNHQFLNALELEKAGCAVILEENKVNGGVLYEKIKGLLSDEELMKNMRENYEGILIENSNQKIFDSILCSIKDP